MDEWKDGRHSGTARRAITALLLWRDERWRPGGRRCNTTRRAIAGILPWRDDQGHQGLLRNTPRRATPRRASSARRATRRRFSLCVSARALLVLCLDAGADLD